MRPVLIVVALFALGCPAPSGDDAGDGSDSSADSAITDAGGPDTLDDARVDSATPPTADVSHERELRGVWIATVFNINWPSAPGLSADAQRAELLALFDAADRAGANAVFLQVRAEADAFYPSTLEPWSRFLTGTMGVDPGYDPLRFAIDEAHARGLELHAWINPYRALATASLSVASSDHVTQAHPELTVPYGSFHWFDPGRDDGLAHTLAVIEDVLSRYDDLDGLHFDDYFYPYPESGVTFADATSYSAYQASGGALSRDDWRRDNVHRMVRAVYDVVARVRPSARFGISPFGIYRPGMPPGISGLDQYATLYSDPLEWMEQGWLDYIAPQLYWPTTQTAQAYEVLLDWWAARAVEHGRTLFIGNFLARLGSSSAWTLDEVRTQIALTQGARDRNTLGNILYHVGPLRSNQAGVRDLIAAELWDAPAASPALVDASGPAPSVPSGTVDGPDVLVTPSSSLRYWAAYRDEGGSWQLEVLAPATTNRITLWRGRWALSAIDRSGLESAGVVIDIAEGDPPGPPPPTGASCVHSFGGSYAHTACSASYQCCDGTWRTRDTGCGACLCVEETGNIGCGT